jgi:hypothetical protein
MEEVEEQMGNQNLSEKCHLEGNYSVISALRRLRQKDHEF